MAQLMADTVASACCATERCHITHAVPGNHHRAALYLEEFLPIFML
jgi:hypothetical protein